MRVLPMVASTAMSLLIAASASAVTMEWTPIRESGESPCETQAATVFYAGGCFGAVSYSYSIGNYEVNNAQYAEFLKRKGASDPLGLYNTFMGTSPTEGSRARAARETTPTTQESGARTCP
jgi:formylglycine-generating enzyme required for sulfatase activity